MAGDDQTFRVNFSNEGVLSLREAVNEKLKEFMGHYTDDTLVEYVIVLLKNGRSKGEAKNELDVFLGDDSDSFISWLWDHLGSNLSLYVQRQELHPDGVLKTMPATGDQGGGKAELHPKSDAEKGNSIKAHVHHHNWENKGLMRNGDENEVPLTQNVEDNMKSRYEPRRRDSRTKRSLSPHSRIHKKRSLDEVQRPRQREVSQTVSAPRRLLQFAVRDAVATSRPSNATTEPSLKRLRSVVSTTAHSSLEEHPQRIRRASMSAAIKSMAEVVKDVTEGRSSRNVFDRLGYATNVSNYTNYQEHGVVANDVGVGVGDGDVNVELENFHLPYHLRNDGSRLQEGNKASFDDTIVDSDLEYDEEDYNDVDVWGWEAAEKSRSGASGGNWVENSQKFQYVATDNADETLHRPRKDLGQPATMHNASQRITLSVSVKPQYQEKIEVGEKGNYKIMLGGDNVSAESGMWLMKENNSPAVAVNKNAKPDIISHQSEKAQIPVDLCSTCPPTQDADSRTIFVNNVHFASTKDGLSRHFNKFGEVLKVIILTDPATGQPKGSAYIEFMRKEAAELALSLNGTSFMSRILKIVKKSSAQPDAASFTTWPHIARASPSSVPRYSRVAFPRGMPSLYRPRIPINPGSRSFQWKRGADSTVTDTSGQAASNSAAPSPTARSLTYIRVEPKANRCFGMA